MNEKEALFQYCWNYVQERIDRLQSEIKATQASANSDTKSSMGDKYETAKAMAQLEIEQNSIQLAEANKLSVSLNQIELEPTRVTVHPGSLLTTTNGKYFIAISIGIVQIDHQPYFIISEESPIGKLFMGKKVYDEIHWAGKIIKILKIQ